MSITDHIQKATKNMTTAGSNVNIKLGNGHSNINVVANNANIDTGCGNQTINAITKGDLTVDTGHCGEDEINAVVGGNAKITTREDDDKVILVVGGNFDVNVGEEEHECEEAGYTWTDNDTVKILCTATEGENHLSLGKGDDNAALIAHNVTVDKGYAPGEKGTLLLGALGHNYTINSYADENIIGAYGDNYEYNFNRTTSKNEVNTLDFWINDGTNGKYIEMDDGSKMALTDMVDDFQTGEGEPKMTLTQYHNSNADMKAVTDFFKDNFGDLLDEVTFSNQAVKVDSTTELLDSKSVTEGNIEELIKKYNLSDKEAATLRKLDLSATFSDGKPLYGIAKVPDNYKTNAGKYVIVKRDGANHSRSVNTYADADGKTYCIAFTPGTKEEVESKTITTEKYKTTINKLFRDVYNVDGVRNWTINQHDGVLNAAITASGDPNSNVNINKCNNDDNCEKDNINIIGGYRAFKDTKTTTENIYTEVKTVDNSGAIVTGKDTYRSPLILDMDHDGVVSAAAGLGVDVDGNGKADGAAINGDKMLAMTDINGNGKVDGAEVFGDQTVSPFTGKSVNAKNGFEALKIIAQQAKQYTGIDCMNGTSVDVKKLQQALNLYGVTLGFVGGANTGIVEDLYGVASIDVGNYKTVNETGDVQHRQQGSYTGVDGKTYKADDVWFKAR